METQLVQLLPDRVTFGALILKRQVSQGSSGELWSKRVVLLFECDEVFGVWWGDGSCSLRKLIGIVRISFPKKIQFELWGSVDTAQQLLRVRRVWWRLYFRIPASGVDDECNVSIGVTDDPWVSFPSDMMLMCGLLGLRNAFRLITLQLQLPVQCLA